ncbi:hypothetical protein HHI36_017232 [Cryptolaemus montrouzieri]|uniref:Uncharacterized protein n=1 Tax=Cryptolaemus montrouzieri TaxID=559131 RepID=A0ABD2NLY8_9CUCU
MEKKDLREGVPSDMVSPAVNVTTRSNKEVLLEEELLEREERIETLQGETEKQKQGAEYQAGIFAYKSLQSEAILAAVEERMYNKLYSRLSEDIRQKLKNVQNTIQTKNNSSYNEKTPSPRTALPTLTIETTKQKNQMCNSINEEADVSINRTTMKLSNEKSQNPERNPNATYADKIHPNSEPSGASSSGGTITKTPENHVIRNLSGHVSRGVVKMTQKGNVSTRQKAQKATIRRQ